MSVSRSAALTLTAPWGSAASPRLGPGGRRPESASRSASMTPTVWLGSTARIMCADLAVGQTPTVPSVRSVAGDQRRPSGSVKTGVTSAMTAPLTG